MNRLTKFAVVSALSVGMLLNLEAAGSKKVVRSAFSDNPVAPTFTAADYSQEQFNKRMQKYFSENDFYGLTQYINGHEIGKAFSKMHGKEMGSLFEAHWKGLLEKKDYKGLEKFICSTMGSRGYDPVLFKLDKQQEREDWSKLREVQRLLSSWGVARQISSWQRELRDMRPEIVAWQAQTKSAELAAEKGREEAWMAKHEKEFEDKIAPIVEEMEYDDALKKFNELINADKSDDDACVKWAAVKAAKIEALWADDLNKNLQARVKEMEEDKKTLEDIVLYVMNYGSELSLPAKVAKLLQAEKMGLVNRLGGKFDEGLVLKEIIKQIDNEVASVAAGTEEGARIRTYQRYLKMINAGRLSKIGSDDKNAKTAMSVALERGHYFVASKFISLNKDVYDPQQVIWSPDAVEWCMTNGLEICKAAFDAIVAGDENDVNVTCLNAMLVYTRRIEEKKCVLIHWYGTDYDERRWGCGNLCCYLITRLSTSGKERFLHNVIANGGFFNFEWMKRPCSFDRFLSMVEKKSINEKFFKQDCAASYLACVIAFMQQNREGSIARDDGFKTIKLLLEKGAPLNVKARTYVPSAAGSLADVSGVTPLQLAVMIGDKEVVDVLLQPEWGANIGEEINVRCADSEGNCYRRVRAKSILELCRKLPWEDDRRSGFSAGTYFTQSQDDRVKIEKLLIDAGASE